MISLVLFSGFCGFYLFYTTSNKVEVPNTFSIGQWVKTREKTANGLGLLLFFISCSLAILQFGWGAGIFAFFVFLMTLACLVVLLNPLRLLNPKVLASVFLLIFLSEVFIS